MSFFQDNLIEPCSSSVSWTSAKFNPNLLMKSDMTLEYPHDPLCNLNSGLPHLAPYPMPNLHIDIGLLTPLLQARHGFDRCEVLPSGEAHRLFHPSTPSRHRVVIGWFQHVNTTTITGAGPKTSHWTSIMLDLTGLDSLT